MKLISYWIGFSWKNHRWTVVMNGHPGIVVLVVNSTQCSSSVQVHVSWKTLYRFFEYERGPRMWIQWCREGVPLKKYIFYRSAEPFFNISRPIVYFKQQQTKITCCFRRPFSRYRSWYWKREFCKIGSIESARPLSGFLWHSPRYLQMHESIR